MPSVRIQIRANRLTVGAWLLTVLVTAGATYGVVFLLEADRPEPPAEPVNVARVEPVPGDPMTVEMFGTLPPPEPEPEEPEPVEEKPAPPPKPKPKPKPEPEPAPPPEPEPEPQEAPDPGVLVRALQAGRSFEEGNVASAERDARALLDEHGSYSGLTAALRADGANDTRARLVGLRVLQLAGHDSIARDVAREMKRSYAGDEQVIDSIRRWEVLRPHITSVDPAIADGRFVEVEGTLRNPDILAVRRVRVVVEALDAGGNLLGSADARVRPRLLEPGTNATFKASLRGIDPAAVVRTRATVVEWESEVRDPG